MLTAPFVFPVVAVLLLVTVSASGVIFFSVLVFLPFSAVAGGARGIW